MRLVVLGGAIADIETGIDSAPGDERHAIAIPGLANVHSHAFQRAMAGMAETRGPAGDDFWTWREAMYRFLDRLGPDDVEAIAALAYVEMLEKGFTRVGEFHYLHHDPAGSPYADIGELAVTIAKATAQTGIALTLLPVFYAHGNFGAAPATLGQRRFVTSIDRFAQIVEACNRAAAVLEDGNVGVAPHSLRAVTPQELATIVPLARGGPVHIHAAEQMREVEDCIAWSGARPVEWLLDNAAIDARWCLVHATHMNVREAERLAASRAVAGFCPVTEANLGDGIVPAEAFLREGGRFGVGTDSNVSIDAADELRMLEYSQRLVRRARNLLGAGSGRSTGRDLFEAALAGGAQALGRPPGGLAVGASADLVSLDAREPAFAARTGDAILDSWMFARGPIDCVWRHGRKLVSGGRHRDREGVVARYRETLNNLLN